MRLRAFLFVLTALAAVGVAAQRLAEATTQHVERAAREQVGAGLAAAGETWAAAQADGLIVELTGAAPDEASRLRAAQIVRQIVDPRRVRDRTTLRAPNPLAPPSFALEVMRNETDVSLIGLAPEASARAILAAARAAGGPEGGLSDMLERVALPAPAGWDAALDFGLGAIRDLPRAKVSLKPGHVAIMALAETEGERAALETALRQSLPDGIMLDLSITAPRPVIAPFALDFVLEDGAPRLDACSADSAEDAATIAAAAGLETADCALGLGMPSPDWAEAAARGIAAVRELGGGRFTIADAEATLASLEDAAPERLQEIGAALARRLSPGFSLAFAAPPRMTQDRAGDYAYAPRFDAYLLADGSLRLTGPVQDAMSRDAIASYAAALFGHERVMNTTVLDPHLPEGWPGRVLTGVEALALMKEGRLEVTLDSVSVEGWAAEADGAARAQALFAAKDLDAALIEVRFDAAAAAAEAAARAIAEDPAGACLKALAEVERGETIAFGPGVAALEEEGVGAIAAFAAAFADCPPLDFEIAGHTDSQGRAESNQRLSEERAVTVKAALDAADLPHIRFVARGFGADRPIAANDTEEGRALNRRIAFTLLRDAAQDGAAGAQGLDPSEADALETAGPENADAPGAAAPDPGAAAAERAQDAPAADAAAGSADEPD